MDRISEFVFSDEVESKECTERSPVTESTGEDANASASASDDAYENLNGSVADAGQRAKGLMG